MKKEVLQKGFAVAMLAAMVASPAMAGTNGAYDETGNVANSNGVINVTASVPKRIDVTVQDCDFGQVTKQNGWASTCSANIAVETNTDFQLSWSAAPLRHSNFANNAKFMSTRYDITPQGGTAVTVDPDAGNDNVGGLNASQQTPVHSYDANGSTKSYAVAGTVLKADADITPRAGSYAGTITIAITPM